MTRLLRLAVLMSLCIWQHPLAGAADLVWDDAGLSPVLVRLSLNRQLTGSTLLVLRNQQDEWLLPVEALTAARIKVPQQAARIFNDQYFLPLSELGSAGVNFDEATQTLDIVLAASSFLPSQVDLNNGYVNSRKPAASAGVFVNYDLSLEHTDNGNGRVLFAETGAAFRQGVAVADFALIRQPQQDLSLRLGTTITIDRPDKLATFRLGDAITRPATILGRPVRFGGVQYATNFMTQPQLVTVPMATLAGQAVLPSTVDVFVNNVLQSRSEIPPGPFSISSVPLVSGDGELQMLVRDLSGREEIISQRFYASPVLLAAGLSEFSLEAGALRNNFGIKSNDYGDDFAAASYRHGISNALTVEGSAQWQQHGPHGLSASASMLFPAFGIASAAMAASHSEAGEGRQGAIGLERKTGRYSIGLRSQVADSRYRSMGVDPERSLRRQDSINLGYRIAQAGNLNLAYARQQLGANTPAEVFSVSFNTIRKEWGSLIFNMTQGRGATDNRSFSVFWIVPLQRDLSSNLTASLLHINATATPDQTLLQVQSNLPAGEGTAFRVQAGINAPQQAAVFAQNTVGQARLEAAEFHGTSSARLNLSGALASIDNHWFASRRITDSFGLVRMPGMENVRIYVDNQLAARTNKQGEAFIPRLHPYMANHVSIEQLDLPLDTQIDALLLRPVPAWRSGMVMEFPVHRVAAATLRLVTEEGLEVPAGAIASLTGQADSFSVGRNGQLYLTGLQAENTVRVDWADGHCTTHIHYVPEQGSIPDLGEKLCVRSR